MGLGSEKERLGRDLRRKRERVGDRDDPQLKSEDRMTVILPPYYSSWIAFCRGTLGHTDTNLCKAERIDCRDKSSDAQNRFI